MILIPDNDWHLVYFLLRLSLDVGHRSFPIVFPIVFIPAENLLIFEQIFQKYEIPIWFFFAVRVGGESGSWDRTHDFEQGQLPRAIQDAPRDIRPTFWGLDERDWGNALPQSFKKEGTILGLGYGDGGCTIFRTNWS